MINNFNFHGNIYLNFGCKKCNQSDNTGCGSYVNSVTLDFETGLIFDINGSTGAYVNVEILPETQPSAITECTVNNGTHIIPLSSLGGFTGFSGILKFNFSNNNDCTSPICVVEIPYNTYSQEVPVSGDDTIFVPVNLTECNNESFAELFSMVGNATLNTNNGHLTITAGEADGVVIYYMLCDGHMTDFVIVSVGNPQIKYSCAEAVCIEDENGNYTNSNCDNQCSGGPERYSCRGNDCVFDPEGIYFNSWCNGQCNQPVTMYSCSGQQCVEDENGQYNNNNCYSNCCLPMNEIISYECIPFVFLGEVNSQVDIIFNQATVTRANGFCEEEIVVLKNYSECCLTTGTYLGYTCDLGIKTKYFNDVECGGSPFSTYTEIVIDDVDCLGASALLFTLEYDDINDAPFVYTDITGWQSYICPTYGRLTDITISGNFMYFYGYNNTFYQFNYGVSGNNIVPVALKLVTFAPGFDRPYTVNIHTDSGISTAISTIDLSTFTNLGYIDLRNNKFTSIDLSAYTNSIGIYLDDNDLTSITIGNNLNLNSLSISNNPIAAIDISLNTSLMTFVFSNTLINTLDVTNNTALGTIQSDVGLLTELDISENVGLITLYLANHPITSADISNNPLLNVIRFDNANLDSVSVNSILSNLVTFNSNNGYLVLSGASPDAQGLLDVAILQSRGWAVYTN